MQVSAPVDLVRAALVELASGVDALYLSGRASLSPELLAALADGRAEAEEIDEDVAWHIGEEQFQLAPRGLGRYKYCLRHPHGLIGLSASRNLPAVRIQPRAEFLHAVGPREAVEWFVEALGPAVGPMLVSVSRVDLFCDVQGWELTGDDRHRFLTRARERVTYEESDELTGYTFGTRKSHTVTCRVYDKTLDARNKGADYWPEIWGPTFDPLSPVLRIEFEFAREALRQCGLDAPGDVLEAVGALWVYATSEWLTYRSPTGDTTRSRWPVAREWASVQRSLLAQSATGIERVYGGKSAGDLRRLMPVLNGCVSSFAAIVGSEDIGPALERLAPLLRDYGEKSGASFVERVQSKRRRFSVR